MEYVDSNVFIHPVLFNDDRALRCRKLLCDIAGGDLKAVTSVLTWDEVVYAVSRTLGHEVAVRQGEMFLQFPNLRFREADTRILVKAQELVGTFKAKPRDAIHAATAMLCGATTIISDDADFDSITVVRRRPV